MNRITTTVVNGLTVTQIPTQAYDYSEFWTVSGMKVVEGNRTTGIPIHGKEYNWVHFDTEAEAMAFAGSNKA